jgi:hypothetical protein
MRSLALFALLSLLLGSAPAMGSDFAFATGDGSSTPGSGPLELQQNRVNQEIHLFLDIVGTDPSSSPPPCVEGATGHEICGFDVTIEIKGGHQIASFAPASNVKFSQQTIDATTTVIHAVGLDAIDPGTDAQLIGLLTLDTGSVEGSVIVRGTVVPADIGVDPLPTIEDETVAVVPEPKSILVLIAGALTLRVLHSLRSRRDSFFALHAGH